MQSLSESRATIIFCDVVKFSEYANDKQRELITSLNAEVARELFPLLGTYGTTPRAICLPTGDGLLAVILDDTNVGAVFSLLFSLRQWSDQVTKRENSDPGCPLRVGVHVGTVSIIPDINRLPNVCSEDINTCRRIMDAARDNQVLFSEKAYTRLVGGSGGYASFPFSADHPARFCKPTTIVVKHKQKHIVRAMKQETPSGEPRWNVDAPISLPDVIEGPDAEYERARLIVEQLNAVRDSDRQAVKIYEMAGFSSFSIQAVLKEGRLNQNALSKLCEQLKSLEEIICCKRADVRVILKPIDLGTKHPDVLRRYRELATWMERNLAGRDSDQFRPQQAATSAKSSESIICHSTVQFVEWQERDAQQHLTMPNRLVIKDVFRIDGYRLRHGPGHELSLVYYEGAQIADAVADLDEIFENAWRREGESNKPVLNKLRRFLKNDRSAAPRTGKPRIQRLGKRSRQQRVSD